MDPIGFSARKVAANDIKANAGAFNSDLAFRGETAVQGTYSGFRLIDIDDPDDPKEIIDWEECHSPTGPVTSLSPFPGQPDRQPGRRHRLGPARPRPTRADLPLLEPPTPAPTYLSGPNAGAPIPTTDALRFTQPGGFCGDWPMFRVPGTATHPATPPATDRGEEGVHIIDVSDPEEPEVVAFVDTPCGSHTETLVPDLRNNRLLIYSNPSANTTFGSPAPGSEPIHCRGFDIIEVPLRDPSQASYLRFEQTGHEDDPPEMLHPCHDTGVILGDVNKVACAGGSGPTVWSIDPADGGSKEDPEFMFHRDLGTSIGHTASFSWDGEVVIFGHEPGGGSQAQCQASSSVLNRTLFFIDSDTGETLGEFLHPRPQTNLENCTWHNLDVVPLRDSDDKVLVSGNYQSGISVVDFSDPENAEEIAFADPAPLVNPNNPAAIELGGDWSTYWYDGEIYESDILRGLIVWKLNDRRVRNAIKLGRSNPQTQEFSIRTRRNNRNN